MTEDKKAKIIVVVGPTASGKTSLSIELAKHFNGEIISADSRQVYRGLDIGSGKVTKEEMDGVPHHLLDVADPSDVYTVSDFVHDGRTAITKILEKEKLPIVVGGTFFYVDALLGEIQTPEVPPNPELRVKLEKMQTDQLYSALLKLDKKRALSIDQENKRRLIRALEIVQALGKVPTQQPKRLYTTYTIGIDIPKEVLHKKIHERLYARVEKDMIKEVETLIENGMTKERLEDLGLEYRYIGRYLHQELTKEEMLKELETKIRQFAKRQMTWLKRGKNIHWFELKDTEKIHKHVGNFLLK